MGPPRSSPQPAMKPVRTVVVVFAFCLAAASLAACATLPAGPVGNRAVPEPTKSVDLKRYVGLWYETARYENRFERNCEAVTAAYRALPNRTIEVVNSCRQGAVGGPLKVAKGRAKVVRDSQDAKLKVSFFGPFFGDYWVLDHADDYSWSIVGEPSGRYLWILTREANPQLATREKLQARAGELGYDTKVLRWTAH